MATADLFPGFASHWIETSVGKIFARSGGKGPPLLVLHGFPQTHVQWHKVADELARHFTLVLPDLPGYGWSVAPPGGKPAHSPYTKREMGGLMIEVMEKLGHVRFAILSHDRGSRVGYRMALDHPGRVERLCVVDILPTYQMWNLIRTAPSPKNTHWLFLSGPEGEPEAEIGKDPDAFLKNKLSQWSKAKDLSAYDPRAVEHYTDFFRDPTRIHALCEDYRAGATLDLAHDEADLAAGRTIQCPFHVVWGSSGIPAEGKSPIDGWAAFAPHATGGPIDSGHYVSEENPAGLLAAVLPFLTRLG